MKSQILISIAFIFLLASCKQKDNYVPIKGQILSSIDSLPFSSTSFKFYTVKYGGNSKTIHSQPFVTDSTGNFSETINLKDYGQGFAVCWPNGDLDYKKVVSVQVDYMQTTPFELGKIYTKP